MDFEEQLEKAEKSPYPSLVGASVKSADDSPHQNYIHPEKYTGTPKIKHDRKSILNSSIGASLDDLISEGALLGSEEDFDRFLDDKGNVLSGAKYPEDKDATVEAPRSSSKPPTSSHLKEELQVNDDSAVLSPVGSTEEAIVGSQGAASTQPYGSGLENYSTPNLSEYQIGHQISDHSQLLDSVKSYDLSKLPSDDDNEAKSKTREFTPVSDKSAKPIRPSNLRNNSNYSYNKTVFGQNAQVNDTESLHAPYFQSDERSPSRSRSRAAFRDKSGDRSGDRSRSSSKSALVPHLARGDSYKNVHQDQPSKYELPADMRVDEDEDEGTEDRRSRQSKPTLGDSIAAAEAKKEEERASSSVTRDPSLVTSGDYTNFNADGHERFLPGSHLYSVRSESSTNYLRSISSSRSRRPAHEQINHSFINEKNDSNTAELNREGALVTDDPISQVDDLDNLMKEVLNKPSQQEASTHQKSPSHDSASASLSKTETSTKEVTEENDHVVNDVSAEEKVAEAQKQRESDSAPTISADDIKIDKSDLLKAPETISHADVSEERDDESEESKIDAPAEVKVEEAKDQIRTAAEPVVTAEDIKVDQEPSAEISDSTKVNPESKEEAEKNTGSDLKDDVEPLPQSSNDGEATDNLEAQTSIKFQDLVESSEQGADIKEAVPEESKIAAITGQTGTEVEEQTELSNEIPNKDTIADDASNLIVEPDAQTTKTPSEEPEQVSASEPAQHKTAEEEDFDVSPEELKKHLESLPIYVYTSLAGGMQIIQRTNRLATILGANQIKFEYKDLGTDEDAKKLWRRYATGQTMPGVVRGDDFIGNWEYIEEVNEDYRLREVLYETL